MSKMHYITLAEALAQVEDPRDARGKRFEWLFLLVVIGAASMSGKKTLLDINRWVQGHGDELKTALQPKKGRIPSLATLRRVVCDVTIATVEEALSKFQAGLIDESGGAGTLLTHDGCQMSSTMSAMSALAKTAPNFAPATHPQ